MHPRHRATSLKHRLHAASRCQCNPCYQFSESGLEVGGCHAVAVAVATAAVRCVARAGATCAHPLLSCNTGCSNQDGASFAQL
eukprot:9285994-Alexandrium_andersonii.AAC.1